MNHIPHTPRRAFLKGLLAAPFALEAALNTLGSHAYAAAQKVKMKAADAKKLLVNVKSGSTPADNFAKGLKYVPVSKVKGQDCANCMHYKKGVTPEGKAIKAKTGGKMQPIGACNLFNQGKGWVAEGGYCMGWAKAV